MSLKKSAFQKNKYSILKSAISREMADFCFAYFLNKRKVARFLFDQRYISPYTEYFGIWNDEQVPNTYSHYSDIAMETLLQEVKPVMEKHTKLKLNETYSYARIYKKGDILINGRPLLKFRLMNEGLALFSSHGLEKTTVSDIVENTKIARGTFYNYFADTQSLFDAIIDELNQSVKTVIQKNRRESKNIYNSNVRARWPVCEI